MISLTLGAQLILINVNVVVIFFFNVSIACIYSGPHSNSQPWRKSLQIGSAMMAQYSIQILQYPHMPRNARASIKLEYWIHSRILSILADSGCFSSALQTYLTMIISAIHSMDFMAEIVAPARLRLARIRSRLMICFKTNLRMPESFKTFLLLYRLQRPFILMLSRNKIAISGIKSYRIRKTT